MEDSLTDSHPQVSFISTWARGTDPYNKFFLPFGQALSGAWPICTCCLKKIKVLRGWQAWWESTGQRLGLRCWLCLWESYFTSVPFFPFLTFVHPVCPESEHSRRGSLSAKDLPLDHLCPIFVGLEESVHLKALMFPPPLHFAHSQMLWEENDAVLRYCFTDPNASSGLPLAVRKYFQEPLQLQITAVSNIYKTRDHVLQSTNLKRCHWAPATVPGSLERTAATGQPRRRSALIGTWCHVCTQHLWPQSHSLDTILVSTLKTSWASGVHETWKTCS